MGAPSTAPAGTLPASFALKIPGGSAAAALGRKVQTVSVNTASVVVTLIKSSNTAYALPLTGTFNVTPSSTICTSDPGGTSRTCTLQLAAPVGTDIFTVDTYDASGNKLGSGAVSMTVAANQANNATVSLGGTIAAVELFSASLNYFEIALGVAGNPDGLPTSTRIYALGFDSSGNPIVVPDTYSTAITLTLSNTSPLSPPGITAATRRTLGAEPTLDQISTISVTYAFPQNGVTSATTSAGNLSVPVYSPEDVITVTVNPSLVGTYGSYLYGSIGALPLTPTSTATLGPLADLYLYAQGAPATASPSPSPVGSPGPLTLSPTTLPIGFGQSTSDGSNTFTATETNYSGTFNVGPCTSGAANVVVSSGNTTTTAGVTSTTYTFTAYPLSPGSCTVAITDSAGGSQNITITNTAIPSTVTLSGISVEPTAAPNPAVLGLGTNTSSSYAYGTTAAALDLTQYAGETFYVFLTDSAMSPTFSTPTLVGSACSAYVSGLSSIGGPTASNYYRFSFNDTNSDDIVFNGCTITFHDSLGTPVVLEVYQNANTLTVNGKARKK